MSLARPSRQSLVLAVILATYLMVVLDVSVVITALPSIQDGLGFSSAGLSWVQSAYALTFGGLLLLGARAGDILGRRRTFVAGVAVFTFASFLGGLAQSPEWLLAARALQGVGAAIAAPSTLALLTTTFAEGPERTRALAAYSAVAGGGGSVGLVLGGLLTDLLSWRWGLWINVPVGLTLMWVAPRVLPETERRPGHFDLPGAAASTAGMTALVFGFVRAAEEGWGDATAVASFAAAAVLLAAFVARERVAAQPITPLRLFTDPARSGAYVARMLIVGGMFSMFFFLTQDFQAVHGMSPLLAGVAFLPMTLVMFSMVHLVPGMSARWGDTRLLLAGVSVGLVGMTWLSRLDETTAYFPGVALPLVLLGSGMGAALAPLTAAGIAGVSDADAGAASGVVNTAQQVGASLGPSILVTLSAGQDVAGAVSSALTGAAVLLALALVVAAVVIRRPQTAPIRPTILETA
jgi:EmrB/QacA subfamily drug resistance transporter